MIVYAIIALAINIRRNVSYYRSDNFQPCEGIGYRIKRLHQVAYALIERRFSDPDLSFTQWIALVLLRGGQVDTCAGLADFTGHDRGATTRMLDGLETRGFVIRERDTLDRRIVRLVLTEAGADACKALTPRVMDFWNDVLDGFERSEIDRFHAMLDAIQQRVDQMAETDTQP